MALGGIKEKLKKLESKIESKIIHPSKHNSDQDSANATSQPPSRDGDRNVGSSHGSPRAYHHPRVTPPSSSQRADVVANGSNGTSSRPSTANPVNDDPLNQTTAPGLHNTNFSLPRVSHDRGDFSNGFGGLTTARDGNFETPLDEGYNSENIANRNVGTSASYVPTYIPTRRPVPNAQEDSAVSRSQPLIPHVDQHASNVADWNIVRNDDPVVDSRAEAPHPLKVKKRSSNLHAADTTPSDVLKHDNAEMRDASWSVNL